MQAAIRIIKGVNKERCAFFWCFRAERKCRKMLKKHGKCGKSANRLTVVFIDKMGVS